MVQQALQVGGFAAPFERGPPAVGISRGAGVETLAVAGLEVHVAGTGQAPQLQVDSPLREGVAFGGELLEERRADAADAQDVDREPAGSGTMEELPVDEAHRAPLVASCHDHRDVPLGRPLGHRPHVHPAPAQDAEHASGDARPIPHAVADHGDDRLIPLNPQGTDRSGLDLSLELGVDRLPRRLGDAGFDRKADRVLARGLGDQDRARAAGGQGVEEAGCNSGSADQVVADQEHQVDVVDRGDAGDRRAARPFPGLAVVVNESTGCSGSRVLRTSSGMPRRRAGVTVGG